MSSRVKSTDSLKQQHASRFIGYLVDETGQRCFEAQHESSGPLVTRLLQALQQHPPPVQGCVVECYTGHIIHRCTKEKAPLISRS